MGDLPSVLQREAGVHEHGGDESVASGVDRLIATKRSRRRDLVVGMIAEGGSACGFETGHDQVVESDEVGLVGAWGGRRPGGMNGMTSWNGSRSTKRRVPALMSFGDEQFAEDRLWRDPPAPARTSEKGRPKKALRTGEGGFKLHSFKMLSADAGQPQAQHVLLKVVGGLTHVVSAKLADEASAAGVATGGPVPVERTSRSAILRFSRMN